MVDTVEAVPATHHETMAYQGVGVRFVALLIDSIILGIIGWVLGILFGVYTTGFTVNPQGALSGWGIVTFIIYIAYYTYLEGTRGQTIGKMAMKIKVVKEDGSRIDIGTAFVRNILRIIDGLIFYLIGAILIWTSHKKQRLGDRAAKTVVIKA
ncbi:MAG: RDD family protein [Methanotrichaceae archaeon]